jgi:hypothetical protein
MVLETSSGMFRLRISFGVLETLSQSMATSGEEVTGLLLGRVRVTDVVEATIEGFTPLVVRQGFVLEGEFSGVERESGRKTEGPPTNLAHGAVGFFRARTAALDQQDRSLLEALLQSSSIAVICLPTEADCMCHVYSRYANSAWNKQLAFSLPPKAERPAVPGIDRMQRRSAITGVGAAEQEAFARAYFPPPRSYRAPAALWIVVVAVLITIGGIAVQKSRSVAETVGTVEQTTVRLNLRASSEGSGVRITWNGMNPVIAGASRGVLAVDEGGTATELALDAQRLRTGEIVYVQRVPRVPGDPAAAMTFRLVLFKGDQTFFAESAKADMVDVGAAVTDREPHDGLPGHAAAVPNEFGQVAGAPETAPPEPKPAGPIDIVSADETVSGKPASNYVGPIPIRRVRPFVPPNLHMSLKGETDVVAITVRVGTKGEIVFTKVENETHANALFTALAVEAAREWRFKPARQNGQAVASDFRLYFRAHAAPAVSSAAP